MTRILALLAVPFLSCSVSWQAGSSVSGQTSAVGGDGAASPGSAGIIGSQGGAPASGPTPIEVPARFQIQDVGPAAGTEVVPKCRWDWRMANRAHLGGGNYGDVVVPALLTGLDGRAIMFLEDSQREEEVDCAEARKVGWDKPFQKQFKGCKDCLSARWGNFEWEVLYEQGNPVYQRKPFKLYHRITPDAIEPRPEPPSEAAIRDRVAVALSQFAPYNDDFYKSARTTNIVLGESANFEWKEDGNRAVYEVPAKVSVAYQAGEIGRHGRPWYHATCEITISLERHREGKEWDALGRCGEDRCSFPSACQQK